MSNDKTVEIRITGSPKAYKSRDLSDQSLVAEVIRNRVLPASKGEYQRVDVKIKRKDDTPDHLVAIMLRKDIYLAEVVRVDVDSDFQVKGIQFNYVDTEDEKVAEKGKDYGEFDFVVGSPVPEFPTAKEAIDFLFDLFTKAGFKCLKMLGPDANLANYKMYLASGLKGFVNVGHGNMQGIALSDGFLDYTWFQSLNNNPLKSEVVYFNSCQVFNNPLLPAINQAGARTFIGGIVNLLVGPSEAVCKCFWSSVLKSPIRMDDAVKLCEKDYPKPGSHGISGDTGPFTSVTPSVVELFGHVTLVEGYKLPNFDGCHALVALRDTPGKTVAVLTKDDGLQSLLVTALATGNLIAFWGMKLKNPPTPRGGTWSVEVYSIDGVILYNMK